MVKILSLLLALVMAPVFAYPECGDNICGVNEDTQSCLSDCKILGTPSVDHFFGDGPAIRGVPFQGGMIVSAVVIEHGKAILQFSIFDANLKELYKSDIFSRQLTGKGELGNPQPLVGPDGAIYLAFRDHILTDKDKPLYRLRVIKSSDNGRTWVFLDDSRETDGFIDIAPDGLWEPFLYFDAGNNLRVVYAKERGEKFCPKQRGKKQDIVTRVSLDHGKTWSSEHVVAGDGISRDGVPSVTRLEDGSYVIVFESWQTSACGMANPNLLIRSMQSPDGIEWRNRSIVFDPYVYSQRSTLATWPFVSILKDGRAVVSFTSNFRNITKDSGKKIRPEEVRTFDIFLLSSTGKPNLGTISWDKNSLVPACEFSELSRNSNRYASLVVLRDGRVVTFSGLPARFVVLGLKGSAF